MQDIAPQLLEAVSKAFQQNLNKNKKIRDLQKKLLSAKDLKGNEAELYAVEVGEALAKAFHDEINADTLPDGRMYYNIASRVIPPPLRRCYEDVADYAQAMYKGMNERAGLGLKAQRAKYNEDRVKGLVEYACGTDNYASRQKNFEGSLVNYSQSVATDTTKANAEFQYDAGLSPVIRRIANSGCCEWCADLAKEYEYPIDYAYDKDPYLKHRDCRCQVLYDPGDGKVQDVHTKRWEKKHLDRPVHGDNVGSTISRDKRIMRHERLKRNDEIERETQKVLRQYYNQATPGTGKYCIEQGLRKSDDPGARECADIIFEKFGGNLTLHKKKEDRRYADYTWNGKLWEHKGVSSKNSFDKQLRTGMDQIRSNPGGFILQVNKDKGLTPVEMRQVIVDRMERSAANHGIRRADIFVIKDGKIILAVRWARK